MSLNHRFSACRDLYKRYAEVFAHFWRRRADLTSPDLEAHEAEFLPAALSLQAQAVSPAGRWVARMVMPPLWDRWRSNAIADRARSR